MVKQVDIYEDFLKANEVKLSEQRRKTQKKLVVYLSVLIIYIFIFAFFFLQGGVVGLWLFPIGKSDQIQDITTRMSKLEERFNILLDPNHSDVVLKNLNEKIAAIEKKNSYLYDTILVSPETAITPKILREEQDHLNEKIAELKTQISNTNSLLTTIFVAIFLAIVGFIAKEIWRGWNSKIIN